MGDESNNIVTVGLRTLDVEHIGLGENTSGTNVGRRSLKRDRERIIKIETKQHMDRSKGVAFMK